MPVETSLPPCCNTGVKPIEVGVDWVQGTLPGEYLTKVCDLIEQFFEEKFSSETKPQRFYEFSTFTPSKIVIAWSPRLGGVVESRSEMFLSIPGSVLACLAAQTQEKLFKALRRFSFSCSRLDLRLDDFNKIITPALAYEAFLVNNIKGFKKHKWISAGTAKESGNTLYLGARGGNGCGKFIRIYDKSFQSKGEIDSTRLELELSGFRSKEVLDILLLLGHENWAEAIKSVIVGAVEFIDRTVDPEHPKRCPRLVWWESIVSNTAPFIIKKPVKNPTFESVKKWVKKQVAPSFAMIMNVLESCSEEAGFAFFYELWEDGEKRMSDFQRLVVQQCIHQHKTGVCSVHNLLHTSV